VIDSPATPWHGYDKERPTNWRNNVLAPGERAELEALWREDFDRGRTDSDIPPELVKKWSAERRRKEKPPGPTEGRESA
jgi:hypothetical protein